MNKLGCAEISETKIKTAPIKWILASPKFRFDCFAIFFDKLRLSKVDTSYQLNLIFKQPKYSILIVVNSEQKTDKSIVTLNNLL